ncbi:hypothetical protein CVS40_9600 [Lucilia cuprina]|nr:hypothetical protein CVS40_9600 [Lucilia cuprina]
MKGHRWFAAKKSWTLQIVPTTIGSWHRNDSEFNEQRPMIVNPATPTLHVSLLQQQQRVMISGILLKKRTSEKENIFEVVLCLNVAANLWW